MEIDFILLLAVLVLVVIGILFIYSSGITSEGFLVSDEYQRQIIWAAAGLVIALVIAMLNYQRVYDLSVYFYLGTIVLLLITFLFGRIMYGSRWLRIGSFSIQASEFAKLTTILFLAWYLDSTKRSRSAFSRFIISSIIVMVPMLLVLIQPDLGTALVFIPILLGMTYAAGIPLRYIGFFGLSIVFTGLLLVLPTPLLPIRLPLTYLVIPFAILVVWRRNSRTCRRFVSA